MALGWFTVDFVCRNCNSRFGSTFDSDLRKNGYVHAALKSLRSGSSYLKGQDVSWSSAEKHHGKMGVPRGFDELIIIPSRQADGSVISDERLFMKSKLKELRKLGWTEPEIQEHFIEVVADAPLGKPVQIARPGERSVSSFIRHGNEISIQYNDMVQPIRHRLVAKIALELWIAFGLFPLCRFNPEPLIGAINGEKTTRIVVLEPPVGARGSVYDLKYSPFHYCAFGVFHGVAVALIDFFGLLSYAITLGEVISSDVGDWRTYFWIFPVSDGTTDQGIYPSNPRLETLRFEFLRMEIASGMCKDESKKAS